MDEKKKETMEKEMTKETESIKENVPFQVEEKSTSDLEEWIEEQGIQLRY